MRLANGIRKHGFRTWHERQLLIAHGWLAIALITAVAAFAALETVLTHDTTSVRLGNLAASLLLGGVTLATLRRFLGHLVGAQRASAQARCTECDTFGRLEVVTENQHGAWVRVRCRQCGHQWPMDEQ